jgi:hypothetical protein
VDAAPVVGEEVAAGLAGGLVDGEVRLPREGEGDAAQAEAPLAVGDQVQPPIHVGTGSGWFGFVGHRRQAPEEG